MYDTTVVCGIAQPAPAAPSGPPPLTGRSALTGPPCPGLSRAALPRALTGPPCPGLSRARPAPGSHGPPCPGLSRAALPRALTGRPARDTPSSPGRPPCPTRRGSTLVNAPSLVLLPGWWRRHWCSYRGGGAITDTLAWGKAAQVCLRGGLPGRAERVTPRPDCDAYPLVSPKRWWRRHWCSYRGGGAITDTLAWGKAAQVCLRGGPPGRAERVTPRPNCDAYPPVSPKHGDPAGPAASRIAGRRDNRSKWGAR